MKHLSILVLCIASIISRAVTHEAKKGNELLVLNGDRTIRVAPDYLPPGNKNCDKMSHNSDKDTLKNAKHAFSGDGTGLAETG